MASPQLGGIGRTIDPSYPSNLFVLAASVSGGAVGSTVGLVSGDGLVDYVLRGVAVGMTVFLAWALGRELDPDRPWTAGVAAVAAGFLVMSGRPSLGQTALLMLAARITARSTGLRPTLIDAAVVVAGSGLVAATAGGFPVAATAGILVAADGHLPDGRWRRSWPMAAAMLAAAVVGSVVGGTLSIEPTGLDGGDWPAAALATLAVLGVARRPQVTVPADFGSTPLQVARVWVSRCCVALAGAGAAIWIGGEAIAGLSPVWAALAVVALPDFPSRKERSPVI